MLLFFRFVLFASSARFRLRIAGVSIHALPICMRLHALTCFFECNALAHAVANYGGQTEPYAITLSSLGELIDCDMMKLPQLGWRQLLWGFVLTICLQWFRGAGVWSGITCITFIIVFALGHIFGFTIKLLVILRVSDQWRLHP